jgi:hypothetical protein
MEVLRAYIGDGYIDLNWWMRIAQRPAMTWAGRLTFSIEQLRVGESIHQRETLPCERIDHAQLAVTFFLYLPSTFEIEDAFLCKR